MPLNFNIGNLARNTSPISRGVAAAAAELPVAAPPAAVITPPVAAPQPPAQPPVSPRAAMPAPTAPQMVAPTPVTALARAAISQLISSEPATVVEALRTIGNQRLTADALMDYLERKLRIGEVLASRAAQWTETTRGDFAGQNGAFQMLPDRLDVMDAIVAIAVLNDRTLESEIRGENTGDPTTNDLLKNRQIVWQSPPAGTVLTPPYIVVIAVEYRDVASADAIVDSIRSQLGDYQGTKLPLSVIKRL